MRDVCATTASRSVSREALTTIGQAAVRLLGDRHADRVVQVVGDEAEPHHLVGGVGIALAEPEIHRLGQVERTQGADFR